MEKMQLLKLCFDFFSLAKYFNTILNIKYSFYTYVVGDVITP